MSYILDALRKAERERHLGQPPSLAVPPPPHQPAQQRLWLWLGAGLVLGLNAALPAFFLTRPQSAAPPVVTTAPPAPETPAPRVAAPLSAPSTPSVPRSLPPAEETVVKVESPATAWEPAQPTAAAATAKSMAPPPSAPRKEPIGNPVVASEPSRPATAPSSRDRRGPSARPPLTPGSVTLAPEPEPIPPLEALSAGARRGIPALNLDIHIYSDAPDKRFVVINGRRYREGDRLGEGPVLETVAPDGAILRQGAQRFRLSVRR